MEKIIIITLLASIVIVWIVYGYLVYEEKKSIKDIKEYTEGGFCMKIKFGFALIVMFINATWAVPIGIFTAVFIEEMLLGLTRYTYNQISSYPMVEVANVIFIFTTIAILEVAVWQLISKPIGRFIINR